MKNYTTSPSTTSLYDPQRRGTSSSAVPDGHTLKPVRLAAEGSTPLARPCIVPLYDPQRSDITSDGWPFDDQGRFAFTQQPIIAEEISPAQSTRNQENEAQVWQRGRRRSMISSFMTSVHGDSQLLVLNYSASTNHKSGQPYSQGLLSQPSMEFRKPEVLEGEEEDDEPGEGVLAWLHTLAGFFCIFNAQ